MSLRLLMDEYPTRKELKENMVPMSRIVEFTEVNSAEECQRQISNNMRFIRLALKEHGIPVTVQFRGAQKKTNLDQAIRRCSNQAVLKWHYPEFGTEKRHYSKVPQLLHLLNIINDRMKVQKCATTVRDIYYGNVELFGSQKAVEVMLHRIENMFKVEKRMFNIVSTQKGLIFSDVDFSVGNHVLNKESQLVPYMTDHTVVSLKQADTHPMSVNPVTVIVLEKDAIFQQLVRCSELTKGKIIITGKGYPDLLTRVLLYKMDQALPSEIEFHIYTDSDAYGIDIITKYMSHPTLKTVQCSRLVHKGVMLNQLIKRNNTDKHQMLVLLALSQRDITFAMNLLSRLCRDTQIAATTKKSLQYELQRQLFYLRKGEMNAVSNGDVQQYFLSKYRLSDVQEKQN